MKQIQSKGKVKYHTRKKCVEPGCNNPAGTAWSPHWCFLRNAARMNRITASFESIKDKLK